MLLNPFEFSVLSLQETSPQRIPASVAPPTLLTPQVFRQRATSDVPVSSVNPLLPSSASPALSAGGTTQGAGDLTPDRRQTVPILSLGGMGQQSSARVDMLTKDQFREAFIHLLSVCMASLHYKR